MPPTRRFWRFKRSEFDTYFTDFGPADRARLTRRVISRIEGPRSPLVDRLGDLFEARLRGEEVAGNEHAPARLEGQHEQLSAAACAVDRADLLPAQRDGFARERPRDGDARGFDHHAPALLR